MVSRFPDIWLRRAVSWLAYFALIAVSCVLQYWITIRAEDERDKRLETRGTPDDSEASISATSVRSCHIYYNSDIVV